MSGLIGRKRWFTVAVTLALAAMSATARQDSAGAAGSYDWLQFNGDAQHSGNNTQESILSPSTVAGLQRIFQVALPSIADGAPVYLSNVSTPTGIRDLVFLTTKGGHILARDARTGATVWSHQVTGVSSYTTSSPVIDPGRQ